MNYKVSWVTWVPPHHDLCIFSYIYIKNMVGGYLQNPRKYLKNNTRSKNSLEYYFWAVCQTPLLGCNGLSTTHRNTSSSVRIGSYPFGLGPRVRPPIVISRTCITSSTCLNHTAFLCRSTRFCIVSSPWTRFTLLILCRPSAVFGPDDLPP